MPATGGWRLAHPLCAGWIRSLADAMAGSSRIPLRFIQATLATARFIQATVATASSIGCCCFEVWVENRDRIIN